MLLENERKLIVEYGKKLIISGLTTGTSGNLSVYNRSEELMAISPSSMDYFEVKPADVVVMDLQGTVVQGKQMPSVEHAMHRLFYAERQDVNAVVHTHALACCTMAALHWSLPAAHYLVALCGASEVPCSEYAPFATSELAGAALKAMGGGSAVFLANHGFVSVGSSLKTAFSLAEEIERCTEIYLRAKAVGAPKIISEG
ncbi:MAG: L-fuculose-phosphate aldolase [Coriobacteriales bacterium]|jgi:L-fuculose-phosphate aldolase|nr:L-fuculose-phosphate aldolase [Coriobacteriales bacterium]